MLIRIDNGLILDGETVKRTGELCFIKRPDQKYTVATVNAEGKITGKAVRSYEDFEAWLNTDA